MQSDTRIGFMLDRPVVRRGVFVRPGQDKLSMIDTIVVVYADNCGFDNLTDDSPMPTVCGRPK
jgi:hypothetical protein